MKKTFLFIFTLIISFLFLDNVLADDYLQCVYSVQVNNDALDKGYEYTAHTFMINRTDTSKSELQNIKSINGMKNNEYNYGYSFNVQQYVNASVKTGAFKCPKLYYVVDNNTRYVSIELEGVIPDVRLSEAVEIPVTPSDIFEEKKEEKPKSDVQSNDRKCPLGPQVTKDLSGVLKIFKIAAPLLMIGFTAFEVIKSLTKGDINSEMKTLYKRLIKRAIYTVLLFFLPIIVDQVFQIANIWDAEGGCTFSGVTPTHKVIYDTEYKDNVDCSTRDESTCRSNDICTWDGSSCVTVCSVRGKDTCTQDSRCKIGNNGLCTTNS